ncbi:MAG: hypothetical protein GC129_06895 [Proteobacteria bacterium]|nr:hypothetical protein [Pseudomonadota bacterium]
MPDTQAPTLENVDISRESSWWRLQSIALELARRPYLADRKLTAKHLLPLRPELQETVPPQAELKCVGTTKAEEPPGRLEVNWYSSEGLKEVRWISRETGKPYFTATWLKGNRTHSRWLLRYTGLPTLEHNAYVTVCAYMSSVVPPMDAAVAHLMLAVRKTTQKGRQARVKRWVDAIAASDADPIEVLLTLHQKFPAYLNRAVNETGTVTQQILRDGLLELRTIMRKHQAQAAT